MWYMILRYLPAAFFGTILLGWLFGLQFALVIGTTSIDPCRLKLALAVACAKNDGFRKQVTETRVGRSRAWKPNGGTLWVLAMNSGFPPFP
jgi:hypothetical protein